MAHLIKNDDDDDGRKDDERRVMDEARALEGHSSEFGTTGAKGVGLPHLDPSFAGPTMSDPTLGGQWGEPPVARSMMIPPCASLSPPPLVGASATCGGGLMQERELSGLAPPPPLLKKATRGGGTGLKLPPEANTNTKEWCISDDDHDTGRIVDPPPFESQFNDNSFTLPPLPLPKFATSTSCTTTLDPPSLKSETSFGEPMISPPHEDLAGLCSPLYATACDGTTMWELDEFSLQTVPPCYPLERTSEFIPHTSTNPQEIAKRITSVLAQRSIMASYESRQAKSYCRTSDGVEFRIRLFAGKGKFHHGIIVEVQRRGGFSVNYHNDCTAILEAAKGNPVSGGTGGVVEGGRGCDTIEVTSTCLPPLLEEYSSDQSTSPPSSPRNSLESCSTTSSSRDLQLTMATSLLTKDQLDSNLLGLKMLTALTHPTTASSSRAAARNSNAILYAPRGSTGAMARDVILCLVEHRRLPQDDDKKSYGDDDFFFDDASEKSVDHRKEIAKPLEYSCRLRSQAVQVLINVLSYGQPQRQNSEEGEAEAFSTVACSHEDDDNNNMPPSTASPSASSVSWLYDRLLPALAADIHGARERPNEATLAATCLSVLIESSCLAREKARGLDFASLLAQAREVGKASHAGLEMESSKCVTILSQ